MHVITVIKSNYCYKKFLKFYPELQSSEEENVFMDHSVCDM